MTSMVLHIAPPTGPAGSPAICLRDWPDEAQPLRPAPDSDYEPLDGLSEERAKAMSTEFRNNSGTPAIRANIGVYLYGQIAGTKAGKEWIRRCTENAAGNNPAIRTYLHIEPEFMQDLPWELMAESTDKTAFAPFRTRNHHAVRGLFSLEEASPALRDELPLSILVLVYHTDHSKLTPEQRERSGPQTEIDAIFAALNKQPGIWHVEICRGPTRNKLERTLREVRPHILHVIGETYGEDEPSFEVRRDGKKIESLAVSDLVQLLYLDEPPRLLVLNGCRTAAMTSKRLLRELRSQAIVTNQAIVYGPPAITFTHVFYRVLAETGDLARAMMETRVTLWQKHRDDPYHWGIPVLTTFCAPDQVIQKGLKDIAERARGMIQDDDYDQPGCMVDRLDPSRLVLVRYPASNRKRVALISGPENSGKSQLLRTCMLTWRLRGHPAVLLDPEKIDQDSDEAKPHDTREILLRICDELAREFTNEHDVVARLAELTERAEQASYNEDGKSDAPFPYAPLYENLTEILKAATAKSPLMLLFDSIDRIFPVHLRDQLRKSLFEPIATGHAGQTVAVLAVREKFLTQDSVAWLNHSSWTNRVERVKLDWFRSADALPLGREYGARRGYFRDVSSRQGNEILTSWIKKVEEKLTSLGSPWPPSHLPVLASDFETDLERRGVRF